MIEIFDIEQFSNYHSYYSINKDTLEHNVFVIHSSKNEIREYIEHLEKVKGMIGFNNISYDYPMIHYILSNKNRLLNITADEINKLLYTESQRIINEEWSSVPEWLVKIPQLDLFKIWHFDNKAKSSSLKDIAIVIKHETIQDLPYHYTHIVKDGEIENIVKYNANDVIITKKLFDISKEQIKLRLDLNKEFKLNLTNANEPKIGAELFLHFLSKELKINDKELRKLRTYRNSINLGECMVNYVKYNSKQFNEVKKSIESSTIKETKKSLEYSVIYKGFKYDFGTGGIHGAAKPGIYESDKDYIIMSSDVASYYPNLSIKNGFYPQHLTKTFCKVYEWLFEERKKIPKSDKRNGAYKLALNGTYGKSNDVYSFFYDPKFTMQITVNGQLLLTMLTEKLQDVGFEMLIINTDGFEVKIPRDKESIYLEICDSWMKLTRLTLEHNKYNKIVLRDVNNYTAVDIDNKIKYKGAFEIEKDIWKDPSFKIVQIALSKYFIDNIPIETTIKNHADIYDFCGRFKANKGWYSEIRYPAFDETNNPYVKKEKLQKTNRYYISTNGATYLKINDDGREHQIEAGWKVSIFNNYIKKEMSEYNINYKYYINECMKIIRVVEPQQLTLF